MELPRTRRQAVSTPIYSNVKGLQCFSQRQSPSTPHSQPQPTGCILKNEHLLSQHHHFLVQVLPPPRSTQAPPPPSLYPPPDQLTCGFDSGPPAAGPAGSAEEQVSCGTGPSLIGPGQAGLKGSPHSQGVPWKVPEVSFGCLAVYLVSVEGRGPERP